MLFCTLLEIHNWNTIKFLIRSIPILINLKTYSRVCDRNDRNDDQHSKDSSDTIICTSFSIKYASWFEIQLVFKEIIIAYTMFTLYLINNTKFLVTQ